MRAMLFPESMIGWVRECVSTAHFSISMNGYLEGHFNGGRGLRQGDPISPYLFLMFMEAFSCTLKENIMQRGFKFHPSCEQLQVSHLCFTDDLFLFSAADIVYVGIIKDSLEEFSSMAGLYPNLQKSSIFMAGVNDQLRVDICNLMGMEIKEFPVKYLGFPLISTRLKSSDREELKNKFLKRILSWHSRLLSYAGRV